jgi:hypothetical protein
LGHLHDLLRAATTTRFLLKIFFRQQRNELVLLRAKVLLLMAYLSLIIQETVILHSYAIAGNALVAHLVTALHCVGPC